MQSKVFSIGFACAVAVTLLLTSSHTAQADYPGARAGYVHHGNHVHRAPQNYYAGRNYFGTGAGLTIGRGGFGISIGSGYAPSRFNFQPSYIPNYRSNYRPNYGPTYLPNVGNPLVVPRYSNGAYRQFYIDPSNYRQNTVPYVNPTPYGNGVDRYEFQRFQQETRDQLQQLSDQQRRTNAGQQQLERNQQQLDLGQRRLEREQQNLSREQQDLQRDLQDIHNLLRK